MPLITFENITVGFGAHPLLNNTSLQLDAGERVCLIGRNGAGKSTLLKLITGEVMPDAGTVRKQPQLRTGCLAQDVSLSLETTVFEAIAAGLPALRELLTAYHDTTRLLSHDTSPAHLNTLAALQQKLETLDGWRVNQRIETIISRLSLPADTPVRSLSGGWRRRVALGQALVADPELLLLDEPTNHLDLEAITWLEEQLKSYRGGLLFITHDRALLQNLATRIVELDRGNLTSWPGDYANFLSRKAAALAEEARQNDLFDKRLAREEVWIRQGIKARRTRNEGRVRALKALREQRRQRRDVERTAEIALESASPSGRLVITAERASFAYATKPIVHELSLTLLRGDRIGIIGPNGAGKSTLLRLLLGSLTPTSGKVTHGTRLKIAYFDQLRAQLDPETTVLDSVAEGRESITLNGKTSHILGYLQEFLFSPDRARVPVKALSGGEANRLLLARLFSQPCNVLVMDEPTNDLDIETLELLEDILANFDGTLLLVSHDRAFLDNIVTSTLVFEGDGLVGEYVGGYSDWLRQRPPPSAPAARSAPAETPRRPESPTRTQGRKLSFREQRELEQLPETIDAMESEQASLHALVSSPGFYQRDHSLRIETLDRLAALEIELATTYARWNELETRLNELRVR